MTKSFDEWARKQESLTRDEYETKMATLHARRDCALATYRDTNTLPGDSFIAWHEYSEAQKSANRLFFQGLRLGYVLP